MYNFTVKEKPWFLLLLIWLFLTAINICKPFQMDDGFHLEAAQNILKDPLRPMSGMIRWDYDEPTPMYVANQPPLLFYMIAGVSLLFGFNEIPLHLFISIFSFLALFWFYKLTHLIHSQRPLLLLALLGLCPAFVVSQNVMTDVPILSLMLGALYYLLLGNKTHQEKFNFISVLLLSIAIFIKYTVLPLLAAIGIVFILQKKYKSLLWLLIPVTLLILWTVWNYWEFGSSHILSRKAGSRSTFGERVWTFFTCLGSMAIFGLLSLTYLIKQKIIVRLAYISSTIFIIIAVLLYIGKLNNEDIITKYLEVAFLLWGGIIFFITILWMLKKRNSNTKPFYYSSPQFIIFIFFASLTLFLLGFAPFMGTRHILLIVPLILLLCNSIIEKVSNALVFFVLICSFIFSTLLGISDWKYAFYYKNAAAGIMKGIPSGSTVWATGTGAWQWYSKQNGMKQYSINTAQVQPGDYIIIASGLPAYKINPTMPYAMLAKIWGTTSVFDYVSVSHGGSIYSSTIGKPSWRLSKRVMDTIYVCQFIKE